MPVKTVVGWSASRYCCLIRDQSSKVLSSEDCPGDETQDGIGIPVVNRSEDRHQQARSHKPAEPLYQSKRDIYKEKHCQPRKESDEDKKQDSVILPEIHLHILPSDKLKNIYPVRLYHTNLQKVKILEFIA